VIIIGRLKNNRVIQMGPVINKNEKKKIPMNVMIP
jgi:hypothetical protein